MLQKEFSILIICVFALVLPPFQTAVGATDDEPLRVVQFDGSFEEARFALEDAIVSRGLKIEYVGDVGGMLKRTAKDFPDSKPIYKDAVFFTFCSVPVTRGLVEASPENIGFCPYIVFVYELLAEPGQSYLGYRNPVGSGSNGNILSTLDRFLSEIIKSASE